MTDTLKPFENLGMQNIEKEEQKLPTTVVGCINSRYNKKRKAQTCNEEKNISQWTTKLYNNKILNSI